MQIHDASEHGPDEPDDGWVIAPTLVDTEITSITLCRFSGMPRTGRICAWRRVGRHEDIDCESLYYQAEALAAGRVDQAQFPTAQQVTRVHSAGDDAIGTTS